MSSAWEWKENNFAQVIEILRTNVRDAVYDTAEHIVEDAQERAPVDTGALRASIHPVYMEASLYQASAAAAKLLGKKKNRPDPLDEEKFDSLDDEISAAVDVSMPYATFVEFGAYNVKAGRFVVGQPFLVPAFAAAAGVLERNLKKAMGIRAPRAPRKQLTEQEQREAWQRKELAAVRKEEREWKASVAEDMRAKIPAEQFQRQRFNVKNMDSRGRATYQRETFGEMWERLRKDYEGMK